MSIGAQARLAGLLYLVIIVVGIWGEAFVRSALVVPADATATALALTQNETAYRAALLGDLVMALCDAGVAVLLFVLLRPLAPVAALAAMVFRLVQTAVIGANMLVTASALLLAGGFSELTLAMMDLRSLGYDIGLGFFGICNILLGVIFMRHAVLPSLLGGALAASGVIYFVGTTLHVIAPAILPAFQPAYLVPVLAETLFALWLIFPAGRTLASASDAGAH